MLVGEIKSWAKKNGYIVKTVKGVGYEWNKEGMDEKNTDDDLNEMARKIFNEITDNKFLEYQKEYKSNIQ
jgi:ribose 5-phosphate isomerase RpiB